MSSTLNPVFYDNSKERLTHLILYIAHICGDEDTFGSTMLNKILWASDFVAFGMYGKPITGVPYVKAPFGPVPNGIAGIKAEMVKNGDLHETERLFHSKTQKRVIPSRMPNLDLFDGHQIAVVCEWASNLCTKNARQVSDWSHDRAWKAAHVGEVIPYTAVFISDEPITDLDRYNTEMLARKHNWEPALRNRQ